MTIAVDTNILFDILLPDPKHVEQSLTWLNIYSKKHHLVISEIVYGELASQFTKQEKLEQFLADTGISLVCSSEAALWEAAIAWKTYKENRTSDFQCKTCGNAQKLVCAECDSLIVSRQHILPDFLIGGHAFHHAGYLLTRDRSFYIKYFPKLSLPGQRSTQSDVQGPGLETKM